MHPSLDLLLIYLFSEHNSETLLLSSAAIYPIQQQFCQTIQLDNNEGKCTALAAMLCIHFYEP